MAFTGTSAELVRAYQRDRHALERRYEAMTDVERAALACRQGADHIVAAAPKAETVASAGSPLELLHVEGRYAVYRLRESEPGVAPRSTSVPTRVAASSGPN